MFGTCKFPSLCWGALCVDWGTLSTLSQAADHSALAFTSSLYRALRFTRGEKFRSSQIFQCVCTAPAIHTAIHRPVAFSIPRAIQNPCGHLIVQLFLSSFLISLSFSTNALHHLREPKVKQLPLNVFDKYPQEQVFFFALGELLARSNKDSLATRVF